MESLTTSDEDQQVDHHSAKVGKDPLTIHGGPMTRAKAKRMKEALMCLMESIWKEQASQDLVKVLRMQEEPKMVNKFQASPNHEDRSPTLLE